MSATYTVKVPPTRDQGNTRFNASASYMQTMREDALDTYNRMRSHDGQDPVARMPNGTTYVRVPRA